MSDQHDPVLEELWLDTRDHCSIVLDPKALIPFLQDYLKTLKSMYEQNEYLNTLEDFFKIEVVSKTTEVIAGADLYRRYVGWCLSEENRPASEPNFYRMMKIQGFSVRRLSIGWIALGLSLRDT